MRRAPMKREKFEVWLVDDEIAVAHQHMTDVGIKKKSDFTRAALLSGVIVHHLEQDSQVGELAISVNALERYASAGAQNEIARLLPDLKALTRSLQRNRALVCRAKSAG